MTNSGKHEWRQSGKDACLHAFPADGGYMAQTDLLSVMSLNGDAADDTDAFFGPYEAFIAQCGHTVPVAMLLPSSSGTPCATCELLTCTSLRTAQGPPRRAVRVQAC